MITYRACPCCSGTDIATALSALDHTVSGERFAIWHCKKCTARFTQDVPGPGEITKYYQAEEYISHSDTKKGLINAMYHTVRNRTLKAKRKMVKKFTGLSSGSLLDIGAGTGSFLDIMKRGGWEVAGLEPDGTARANAVRLHGLQLNSPDELFNLPSRHYDAISLWHVLEHVHDLHPYLEQLKRLLKPSGRIFIAVPNYTSHDAKLYGQHWAAWDVPRHLYHFSPAAVSRLLLLHGMQLEAIRPMWYDSLYVSMLSEKYRTGKNNYLRAAWNGTVSNLKAFFDHEKCSSLIYIIKV